MQLNNILSTSTSKYLFRIITIILIFVQLNEIMHFIPQCNYMLTITSPKYYNILVIV